MGMTWGGRDSGSRLGGGLERQEPSPTKGTENEKEKGLLYGFTREEGGTRCMAKRARKSKALRGDEATETAAVSTFALAWLCADSGRPDSQTRRARTHSPAALESNTQPWKSPCLATAPTLPCPPPTWDTSWFICKLCSLVLSVCISLLDRGGRSGGFLLALGWLMRGSESPRGIQGIT